MLPPDVAENARSFARMLAARHGEDPRLVSGVAVEWSMIHGAWAAVVKLRDGRRGSGLLPADPGQLQHDDLRRAVAMGAGEAFERQPPATSEFAASGLPSDYWWNGQTEAQASAARRWVKEQLLNLPMMTDAHADRFIASLDPPKRDDLLRRAVAATPATGF